MAKRSERLLDLMQALRRRRRPVTGDVLAGEMGISIRSLYRDIQTLKSMGAAIDGEAGLGYQLRDDYWLPPLMFSEEEIEALVLGLRSLIHGPDAGMAQTASDARAKISAVLSPERREAMEAVGLFAIPRGDQPPDDRLTIVRTALREETELDIGYRDKAGAQTQRVIWPVALGYLQTRQMLVAWCSVRADFRQFWIDAMTSVATTGKRYPRARRTLFHEWRTQRDYDDLS